MERVQHELTADIDTVLTAHTNQSLTHFKELEGHYVHVWKKYKELSNCKFREEKVSEHLVYDITTALHWEAWRLNCTVWTTKLLLLFRNLVFCLSAQSACIFLDNLLLSRSLFIRPAALPAQCCGSCAFLSLSFSHASHFQRTFPGRSVAHLSITLHRHYRDHPAAEKSSSHLLGRTAGNASEGAQISIADQGGTWRLALSDGGRGLACGLSITWPPVGSHARLFVKLPRKSSPGLSKQEVPFACEVHCCWFRRFGLTKARSLFIHRFRKPGDKRRRILSLLEVVILPCLRTGVKWKTKNL